MTHPIWLVDFDGTLYYPHAVKLLMGLELVLFGAQAMATIREFRRQHELLRQLGSSSQSTPFDLQLANTADALGVPPEPVRRIVDEWMRDRPCKWLRLCRRKGLIRELERHQEAGGRLGLVSDYPARTKLEAMRLRVRFDAIVASGESNTPTRLKPDPAGYLAAARLLGALPHQCLVIGDRDDADGEAARRAGMAFRLVR